jgi:hypothetical protein
MICFRDGPAKGAVLQLQRAPIFLRVAIDAVGGVDALDQLDDEPREGETLFAYRVDGHATNYHVRCSRPRRSGWVIKADYLLVDPQPDAATMLDNEAWQRWALSQEVT